MKRNVAISAVLLLTAVGAFAQGQLSLNNRIVGIQVSPIYGPDPANPTLAQNGQSPAGTPAGTTSYGGAPLVGTGFSAALYGGAAGTAEGSMSLLGSTTFRTRTDLAGFLTPVTVTVPGVGENSSAQLQLRVWDNLGGTVTSWDAALARFNSGDSSIALGRSASFLSAPLGGTLLQPPGLIGMNSFNLIMVPEPSTIALGILGGLGTLLLLRRRK